MTTKNMLENFDLNTSNTFIHASRQKNIGPNQSFHGNGKLLLSGEYFIMDGAQGLALPTSLGQSLSVNYQVSFDKPKLTWTSYDHTGRIWLEAQFEFWRFECLDENPGPEKLFLQKILRQARKQNKHFLREEVDVFAETYLDFPRNWGLGSSSTLIYNIAQWAYIGPFELSFALSNGSGYDIACAQSDSPVLYEKKMSGPIWSPVKFNPSFSDNLYFLYLGQKQSSAAAVDLYYKLRPFDSGVVKEISHITKEIVHVKNISEFNKLIKLHEKLIAKNLNLPILKSTYFSDFNGELKSLGAWGGDFALVTSELSYDETSKYFKSKGFPTLIRYCDLIKDTPHFLDSTTEAESYGIQ